jgi:hypothetical protein
VRAGVEGLISSCGDQQTWPSRGEASVHTEGVWWVRDGGAARPWCCTARASPNVKDSIITCQTPATSRHVPTRVVLPCRARKPSQFPIHNTPDEHMMPVVHDYTMPSWMRHLTTCLGRCCRPRARMTLQSWVNCANNHTPLTSRQRPASSFTLRYSMVKYGSSSAKTGHPAKV